MYDAIVFSAGGVRGVSHLGAWAALQRHQRERVDRCTHFIGSSAGALAATTAATRADPERVFLDVILPFEVKEKVPWRGKNTTLDEFLDEFIPASVTFRDVFTETGNVLSIVSTNMSRRGVEIFDPFASPDMSVRSALSASCAVPFFFPSVEIDGEIFVDGGISNPFPIDIARERYGKKKILGIMLEDTPQKNNGANIFESILDLLMWTKITRGDLPSGAEIVELPGYPGVSSLDFDASKLEKIELFFAGYRTFQVEKKSHVISE